MLQRNFKTSLTLTLLLCALTTSAIAQEISRVSVSSNGVRGSSFDGPLSSINADGRFVAFESSSSNLVAGDTNAKQDIFVRDRLTKQTTRISVASDGSQANGDSTDPKLSSDGRFVVFTSSASNLVVGDTNRKSDIFIHDRSTKQTTRVSVGPNGSQGNNASFEAAINADGRYVAFSSNASNLVSRDTNGFTDVFVRDRLTNRTTRVNVASNGTQANGNSYYPSLNADGQFVAFSSDATNLVSGDANESLDIFLHDRATAKTTLVSVASDGTQANADSYSSSLSADGRFIAFSSSANNLIAGESIGDPDFDSFIFVHDQQTHKTTRIDLGTVTPESSTINSDPSISADGRYVALMHTQVPRFIPGSDFWTFVVVYDRVTKKASPIIGGGMRSRLNSPSLSADGRFMSFYSNTDLLDGTLQPNVYHDIYVLDRVLDTAHYADLKLTKVQAPVSLKTNNFGVYHFAVTNNGPNTVNNVNITQVVSNGSKIFAYSSSGACKSYTVISLCRFGKLLPGARIDFFAAVKAEQDPLIQRVTVSGQPVDPVPTNNRVFISTPVTP